MDNYEEITDEKTKKLFDLFEDRFKSSLESFGLDKILRDIEYFIVLSKKEDENTLVDLIIC